MKKETKDFTLDEFIDCCAYVLGVMNRDLDDLIESVVEQFSRRKLLELLAEVGFNLQKKEQEELFYTKNEMAKNVLVASLDVLIERDSIAEDLEGED